MSGFERYACRDSFPVCSWWTDKTGDWARRVRDHVEAAHPARPGLSLVPPANAQTLICRACHQLPCACPQDVIALPPGSVQSDAAALDAQAGCTCAADGLTCQSCSDWFAPRAPRPAPAPIRTWASSITFAADSPAGLVEQVRKWLSEMDGPTQTPVKTPREFAENICAGGFREPLVDVIERLVRDRDEAIAPGRGPTQTHGKEGTS